jgi:GT2 family glycosyltransferase/SAM-dependent methyltransferase
LIELILVIDKDDKSYPSIPKASFPIVKVTAAPGLTMGKLNMAGYRKASGSWIFLLNDDVVVETIGWDQRIQALTRLYDDEICLIHVNDGIFGETLCTFPLVSRTFCDIVGGICDEDYIRYRIDDHIYNIFNLLNLNDYNRIIYVDDLHFEHYNRDIRYEGIESYQPNPFIHAKDTVIFDRKLEDRKRLSLDLIAHIEAKRASERRLILASRIKDQADSASLRKTEFVTRLDEKLLPAGCKPRITIGVVSANIQSAMGQECLASVKKFTENYDLVILDNNRGAGFNHPREMNRIIAQCRTEFLVLIDDDVIVEAGWLEGMLRAMGPDVGVVTPMHKDRYGKLSYAGIAMAPNLTGHHGHSFDIPSGPKSIQTLCSAAMLIDMRKCGHIQVDEAYSKYFLDIDYGFRIWEAGYRVVIAPDTLLTHIGGGTLEQGSELSNQLFELQRQRFAARWYESGRWERLLESAPWRDDDIIKAETSFSTDLTNLLDHEAAALSPDELELRLRAIMDFIVHRPVLYQWAMDQVRVRHPSTGFVRMSDDPVSALFKGYFIQPVLVDPDVSGMTVVLDRAVYHALPSDQTYDPARVQAGTYDRIFLASDMTSLRSLITSGLEATVLPIEAPPETDSGTEASSPFAPAGQISDGAELVIANYYGFDIYMAEAAFAIPTGHGGIDISRARARSYEGMMTSRSPLLLKARIRAMQPGRKGAVLRACFAAVGRKVQVQQGVHQAAGPEAELLSDSSSWLHRSPTRPIESLFGFDIYEFEYKYFACPQRLGAFDYPSFKANGRLLECFVGQSRDEAKALIQEAIAPKSLRSVVAFGASAAARAPAGSIRLTTEESGNNADAIKLPVLRDAHIGRYLISPAGEADLIELQQKAFTEAYVAWDDAEAWFDNSMEAAAARVAPVIYLVFANGTVRRYAGEGVHRLLYNKAYLCSLFSRAPLPVGQTVLEVGCSDGMVCDLLVNMGAKSVVGIDAMKTAGCGFPTPDITYVTGDAHALPMEDESFDMVVTIATFEHLSDPERALSEIMRVLKPGGYAYIQAGPLYHSPFGHHMFGFFDEWPWIHLRKSSDEIGAIAEVNGSSPRIQYHHGVAAADFARNMLSRDHVNGLMLKDYALDKFVARDDVTCLYQNISYEGANLLTAELEAELSGFTRDQLTEHGFEVLVQKKG